MRLGSPGCEIVSNLLSEMALLKFLVKMKAVIPCSSQVSLCALQHFHHHDIITIGHDQTTKFKFANILVSRISDKVAKFFARQYFGVYGNKFCKFPMVCKII